MHIALAHSAECSVEFDNLLVWSTLSVWCAVRLRYKELVDDRQFVNLRRAMASRRLADLLALALATRNVIKRHAEIQLHAVSRAAATSSITKALQRDFRGLPIQPSPVPKSSSTVDHSVKEEHLLDGKDQDVFYDRSEKHSSPETTKSDELKVSQSQDSLMIDSEKQHKSASTPRSKSSKGINPIQDHHVRKMSTHRPVPSETADDTSETSELRSNIDEDVYYETTASVIPNRDFEPDHIPQAAAQPPKPHDKLHQGINSEIFYDPETNPDNKSSKPMSVYPSMSPV